MVGVRGTVKNIIFQHVRSKKCFINVAKDFAEYANKIINGISCLYLTENEIMAEPQDIETSPKIPGALKVHKVLRTYNEDNVCKIKFYEPADKADPFHIQWYRKQSDPEVCGHNQLPLSYEIDQKYFTISSSMEIACPYFSSKLFTITNILTFKQFISVYQICRMNFAGNYALGFAYYNYKTLISFKTYVVLHQY